KRRPEIGAAIPLLLGDKIFRVLDAAVPELDIAAGIVVLLDLELAILAYLKHLDAVVAELVGGKERTVRPAERDPGNGGLGLPLRIPMRIRPSGVKQAWLTHMIRIMTA